MLEANSSWDFSSNRKRRKRLHHSTGAPLALEASRFGGRPCVRAPLALEAPRWGGQPCVRASLALGNARWGKRSGGIAGLLSFGRDSRSRRFDGRAFIPGRRREERELSGRRHWQCAPWRRHVMGSIEHTTEIDIEFKGIGLELPRLAAGPCIDEREVFQRSDRRFRPYRQLRQDDRPSQRKVIPTVAASVDGLESEVTALGAFHGMFFAPRDAPGTCTPSSGMNRAGGPVRGVSASN
jgi:hypothetical protein